MDKLAECLKIFLEKHLIPSVIAITGAIVTILMLENDNWMVIKLGNTLIEVLFFCIYFLGVEFILKIVSFTRKFKVKIQDSRYYVDKQRKENDKVIDEINNYIDSLIPKDKQLLIGFIENKNKILLSINGFHSYDSLLMNSSIINSSIFDGNINEIDNDRYWIDPLVSSMWSDGMYPLQGYMQYKLKENVYHDLCLIHKQRGKIGNF